jgi:hypothetical protein
MLFPKMIKADYKLAEDVAIQLLKEFEIKSLPVFLYENTIYDL